MQNDPTMIGTTELTEREKEILQLVATGTSNKDIAQQLFISTNTVKVHLRNTFAKIRVASRTEAAMYAVRTGLVQTATSPTVQTEQPDKDWSQSEQVASRTAMETAPWHGWLSRQWAMVVLVILALGLAAGMGIFLTQRPASLPVVTAMPSPTSPSRWKRLADMPTARSGLAVAAYENKIYAIGGEALQGVTGAVETFDPETNIWQKKSPKPLAVSDVGAAVIGGKIYIPGGRLRSGKVTNILEVYDPRQDRWEQGAALPMALSAYAMVAFEGRLYLFGGWDDKQYLDIVLVYDPDRDTWSTRTPMPSRRESSGAVVAGGKIYVLGGYAGKYALTANEEYLPDGDTWSVRAPLPVGRYAMGVASIADIVYVIGGIGKPDSNLSPLQYLYQQNKWQAFKDPFPQQWSSFGLVPHQTQLYGVGGQRNGITVAQNLSYQAIYTIMIPIVP